MKAPRQKRSPEAFALVVVLSFLVLLLIVALAFFSKTATQRQVSASSASRVKTEMLGQLAVNTILGDLRAEIETGSNKTNIVTGSVTNTIYYPTAPSNAVPAISGFTMAAGLENLVKVSSGTGGSTTNASADGRYIAMDRWNKALLLAKQNPTNTKDFTPVSAFPAPTWIYVNRDGTTTTTASANIVGRFAYVIYNEGGLLDANVAGYPTSLTNSGTSFGATNVAYKSALAYADLTQIELTNSSKIDDLVNWRNKASLDGDPTKYVGYVSGNTNGFLTTGNTSLVGGQSDQFFASRQQLIDFFNTQLGGSSDSKVQNALQYLTHFSRGLEQPSFAPASNRPTILSVSAGGNDMAGGDNIINPRLLECRVASSFDRNNGSEASPGEPLVKKRFSLSRLAWLTYQGPSARRNTSTTATTGDDGDIGLLKQNGITKEWLDLGTPDNINKYFGLTWTNECWVYRSGTNQPIHTLKDGTYPVTGREPDFFELLKVSINAGSIGKAYNYTGSNPDGTTPDGYQQQRDNSADAQLMQIGANIIDQYDTDGYPTRIVFNDGLLFDARDQEYRGIEDLPYLYRVREAKLMVRDSDPSNGSLPMLGGDLKDGGLGVIMQQPEIWNPHAFDSSAQVGPRPTAFCLVAETADPNGSASTQYSYRAAWRHYNSGTGGWAYSPTNALRGLTNTNTQLTFSIPTTRLDLFREPTLLIKPNVPNGSLLNIGPDHEIHSLSGTNVVTSLFKARHYTLNSIDDDNKYIGFVLGTMPMAFTNTIPTNGLTTTTLSEPAPGIVPTGCVDMPTAANGITYRLQYITPSGPITYDEKFSELAFANNYGNESGDRRKTFYRQNPAGSAFNIIGWELGTSCVDPRTSRFGMQFIGGNGDRANATIQFPVLLRNSFAAPMNYDAAVGWSVTLPWSNTTKTNMQNSGRQNAVLSNRPDECQGFVSSIGTIIGNAFGRNTGPTAGGWTPSGDGQFLRFGLLCQNDPAVSASIDIYRFNGDDQGGAGAPGSYFFADPDGVVRRGMSAYLPVGTLPATPPTAGRPSGLPTKPAYQFDANGAATPISDAATGEPVEARSRPIVLNRPFRSAAELSYAFSGTPWRNLDISTPESGATALVDVFSATEPGNTDGVVAGKINLNTRQAPVLKAVLAGAHKDVFKPTGTTIFPALTATDTQNISDALIQRVASSAASMGPLSNVGDLIGRWNSIVNAAGSIDGGKSYTGFSDDLAKAGGALSAPERRVQRFREAPMRALLSAGQTRVWNFMLDAIVQPGRLPNGSTSLQQFVVEGEQRLWTHLALDRLTGKIIDKQVEVIRE